MEDRSHLTFSLLKRHWERSTVHPTPLSSSPTATITTHANELPPPPPQEVEWIVWVPGSALQTFCHFFAITTKDMDRHQGGTTSLRRSNRLFAATQSPRSVPTVLSWLKWDECSVIDTLRIIPSSNVNKRNNKTWTQSLDLEKVSWQDGL